MVLKDKNQVIDTIILEKSTVGEVDIYLKEDASILMRQSDNENGYDTEISINDISLPLKSGDVVGKFFIKKNNNIIKKIDLVIKEDIDSKSFFELFIDLLKNTLYI